MPNPTIAASVRRMLLLVCGFAPACANAVPDVMARDQVLEIAREHLQLHWYCDTFNIYSGVTDATCPYSTVGWKDGIPYKWGGYDSRDTYYTSVVVNHGWAGDTNSAAIVATTYGDDCSGFVSRALRSGRYTTSGFPSVSTQITYPTIGPGDIMNKASSHVRMFEYYTGTNLTMEIECTTGVSPGRVVRRVLATDATNYLPRRYNYMVQWPSLVRAAATGASTAALDFFGQASTGFRVYQSTDLLAWTRIADETTLGPKAVGATATSLAANTTYYFRVTALNATTESSPSNVLALRIAPGASKALIVNGYDRWTRKTQSAGLAHAFVARYADPLATSGYAFDSCDNLRIVDDTVSLATYPSVWWLLGDESTSDETFGYQEQLRVQSYLQQGGHLFVSGAEVLFDLVSSNPSPINDVAFANNYLHSGYGGDGSSGNGYTFSGKSGTAFAGVSGGFDNGTGGTYQVATPDILSPLGGAQTVMSYGTGTAAAIAYRGTFGGGSAVGSVVVAGFPLETVATPAARNALVLATSNSLFAGAAVEDWSVY